MANWNTKTWENLIAEYPDLEGKTESVAFAVWTLKNQPGIEPAEMREAGAKAGVSVAGRAVGSARQILGLSPASASRKKKGRRRKGGRKKGAVRRTTRRTSGSSESGVESLVDMIKQTEQDNAQMRKALTKIRDLIDTVL